MSKVLITGGAGFIGTHLARYLVDNGYNVDLVDNFSRGVIDNELRQLSSKPGVALINLDLLKPDLLNKIGDDYKYIYHLAAIIGVSNVLDRPYAVLQDNVAMLVNLLSIAKRQAGLSRFVFASTSEVYAGTLRHFTLPIPTPESTPLALTNLEHPRTSYMLSKIYGEALCHNSGVPCTIIRPHNIYGPRMGMSHVIPELLRKARNISEGGKLEVFSVEHKRTFCYVDDAVKMIKLVAESPECVSQTLNIGNQTPEISMRELTYLIMEVLGKRLEIVARAVTPGSPERRCPDMTKTSILTGYSSEVEIKRGIEMTNNWYCENVFSGDGVSAK